MSRKTNAGRGDKAALLALIGIIIIFCAIVGRGWQTLLSSQGFEISLAAGVVMAIIATSLCYAIASERTWQPESKATALAYFFVLFNISALGTLNAMFLMFQSSNIIREHVDKATESVVTLRDIGGNSIDTSDFDRFKASINERSRNLKAELENPQLCGQGAAAGARIEELKILLPSFRSLAGGGHCEKVPAMIMSYEQQINELTAQSPIYQRNSKNIELKQHISQESAKLLDELNLAGKLVSGNYGLADLKGRLYAVAEKYSLLRQELGGRGGSLGEKVPMKIDVRSISALGDIGQVLPFIVSRLNEVSTYVYLIIALVLDIALIAAFARLLREGPNANRLRNAATIRKV